MSQNSLTHIKNLAVFAARFLECFCLLKGLSRQLLVFKFQEVSQNFFKNFETAILRSNHPEVFLEKGVLRICIKFTGEHPCRSVTSVKLQNNFIEITLRHGVFSCKFAAYFQSSFS